MCETDAPPLYNLADSRDDSAGAVGAAALQTISALNATVSVPMAPRLFVNQNSPSLSLFPPSVQHGAFRSPPAMQLQLHLDPLDKLSPSPLAGPQQLSPLVVPMSLDPTPAMTLRSLSRAHQFAGKRYPENAAALANQINFDLSQGTDTRPARLVCVPHGKLSECGQTIAAAVRTIPKSTQTVFVIAPLHNVAPGKPMLSDFWTWETPVGLSTVDALAMQPLKESRLFEAMPERVDLSEYSVETILPVIQIALPGATIVPILVNRDMTKQHIRECGAMLGGSIRGRNCAIVVTCDFGHWGEKYRWTKIDPKFGTGEDAIRATISEFDFKIITMIMSGDGDAICDNPLRKGICGWSAVALGLCAARSAGIRLVSSLASHSVLAREDYTFQGQASMVFREPN